MASDYEPFEPELLFGPTKPIYPLLNTAPVMGIPAGRVLMHEPKKSAVIIDGVREITYEFTILPESIS